MARDAKAGEASLRRGVLIQSLVSGKGGEAGDGRILQDVFDLARVLARDHGSGLKALHGEDLRYR